MLIVTESKVNVEFIQSSLYKYNIHTATLFILS